MENLKNKQEIILELKDLYEAFNAFIFINEEFYKMARNNNIAKSHYVKQDLGELFIYNCKHYGIKMMRTTNNFYLDCTVTRYHEINDSKIEDSKINFIYDYQKNNMVGNIKSFYISDSEPNYVKHLK